MSLYLEHPGISAKDQQGCGYLAAAQLAEAGLCECRSARRERRVKGRSREGIALCLVVSQFGEFSMVMVILVCTQTSSQNIVKNNCSGSCVYIVARSGIQATDEHRERRAFKQ